MKCGQECGIVINFRLKKAILILCLFLGGIVSAQQDTSYKKRVLETAEIDLFFSYYGQDGQNAAVTGGVGTEKLTDATSSIIVKIPVNEDDILTIDAGISAYTSASSSNVNPFDGDINQNTSPFSASSGASRKDELTYFNPSYQHSSDNRNSIYNVKAYVSSEYDYFSIGFGGGYAHLFNEKNTELSINAQVFFDKWNPQYPTELRTGFFDFRITGNGTYTPLFTAFENEKRNSYSVSLGFSQILSKKLQASLFVDLVQQEGLLSTPFQRVYFGDTENFFIEDFQLADDVERLPNTRFKIPIGARLNYYLNDRFILRSYYRFYTDNWGLRSHTANVEVPVKLNDKFTLYPSYRYYNQTAADYFFESNRALSTSSFYTSDYDLSAYIAHQYGLGFRYKDIFAKSKIFNFGLKTIDLRVHKYDRSDGLDAFIVSFGTTFVGN